MSPDATDLDGQHRQLRIDLDRLHLLLLAPADGLPRARMINLLRREARSLSRALEDHFEDEEDGGYMQDVLDARPNLDNRVEDLHRQHVEILERLDAIREPGKTLGDIRSDLSDVLDALGDHERDEVSVLQETFTTDIGEGD